VAGGDDTTRPCRQNVFSNNFDPNRTRKRGVQYVDDCGYKAGLPDFSWFKIPKRGKIPNDHKLYQMAIKYFQWQKNRPNGQKICQDFPLQAPPKFTQIGIFGLKTNHLATLMQRNCN
jgi:hypothetical protein